MLPEIFHLTQPKFSEFEAENKSPEFRSIDQVLALIQSINTDKQALNLIRALLSRVQRLERDLTQLGDAYAYDGMVSMKLEAALDEGRCKDEKITRLQNAMAEYGLDYIDI